AYHAIKKHQPAAQISFTMHWRPFQPRDPLNPLDRAAAYYRGQVFNHLFPKAVDTGVLTFPFPLNFSKNVRAVSGPIPSLKGTMDYLAINYFTREITEWSYALPIDLFGIQSQIAIKE